MKKLNFCFCNDWCSLARFGLLQFFILLVVVSLGYAHKSNAQALLDKEVTISLKNVTLKEAIKTLQEQTQVKFVYSNRIKLKERVSLKLEKSKLSTVLDNLLKPFQINYKVLEKQIILTKNSQDINANTTSTLNHISSLSTLKNASFVVSGRVLDETSNNPLARANILVLGTNIGTTTNENGEYKLTLNDSEKNGSLVFSFVGYEKQTVPILGRTSIDVKLKGVAELNEVVVVGYGSQKKINVTGAVAQLKAQDMTVVPAANTAQLLGGRVMGLITKDSGAQPGSDKLSMSIRGYGSALMIVDGLQTSMTRIDPNEIESVSVLKDASAAIYGARAGNGVILITTKRGQDKQPEISYHGNMSFEKPTSFLKQVDAGQYAELRREAHLNLGQSPGEFTEEVVQKFKEGTEPGFRSYNWTDALLKKSGAMQQHNFNVRGGAKNIKYFASVGYTKQAGIYASDDYNYTRYNGRLNIDVNVSKNITSFFDISYRHSVTEEVSSVADLWTALETAQPRYSPVLPDPTKVAYSGADERNPIAASEKDIFGYDRNIASYVTGRIGLKYKFPFIPGMSSTAELMLDQDNNWLKNFNKPYDVFDYDWENEVYTYLATNRFDITLYENMSRSYQLYPKFTVNYDKNINKHSLNGLFVYEYIENASNNVFAYRRGLISPTVQQLYAGANLNQDNLGYASLNNRASYIGRLNYNFDDKYMLEGILRSDASSNFPPATRWGYFPSISAGWVISKESFMPQNSPFNDIKLRLSYGHAGNDNTSQFSYLTGYQIDGSYYIIGETNNTTIRTFGLPNKDITWEKIVNYNLGIDLGILNNKFVFEANAFYRNRSGLLATSVQKLPSTFGATLPPQNLNTRDNRGFEFGLKYNQQIKDFRFSLASNFVVSREKWVERDELVYTDPDQIRLYQLEGQWVNRSIGYVSDGLFMTRKEITDLPYIQDQNKNSTLKPGDIRYKDLNSDGIIDYRDQTIIGLGTTPQLTASFIVNASWKGLSLDMMFQGASLFNYEIPSRSVRSTFANESVPYDFQYKYRWTPDPANPNQNINPNVQLPATSIGVNANNARLSDFWLKDASYLRLKQVNVAYDVPAKLLSKIGLKTLQIYGAGTNIFTLSKLGIFKDSFDPEAASGNNRVYPVIKNFTIGVRTKL